MCSLRDKPLEEAVGGGPPELDGPPAGDHHPLLLQLNRQSWNSAQHCALPYVRLVGAEGERGDGGQARRLDPLFERCPRLELDDGDVVGEGPESLVSAVARCPPAAVLGVGDHLGHLVLLRTGAVAVVVQNMLLGG